MKIKKFELDPRRERESGEGSRKNSGTDTNMRLEMGDSIKVV